MIELSPTQQRLHLLSSASLVLLIVLCILWELVLAPLRPGGSWMVIKVIPLFAPLAGTLKKNVYTLQWASMLILLYFTEGVVRAWSDHGASQLLAGLEILFSTSYFFCSIFFLRPYKQAAKQLASDVIRKAANPDAP
ncbi:MAG: DUF2069 domain-containing protein [Oxalobacteraceae bacterium]|jgi:uncharacterized membrane protein|nr:DUF2069 domain-containing protein [Oxalobacteraceae bacterium]